MENADLHKLAPPGLLRRLAAGVYDWLLVVGLWFALSVPLVAIDNEAVTPGNPLYRIWLIAIAAGFFIGFWAWDGQTLGMRAWRMRLTDAAGHSVSVRQAGLRFFTACLSAAALGAGFWWILVDPESLGWHDRLSGTRLSLEPQPRKGAS